VTCSKILDTEVTPVFELQSSGLHCRTLYQTHLGGATIALLDVVVNIVAVSDFSNLQIYIPYVDIALVIYFDDDDDDDDDDAGVVLLLLLEMW